ncbi:MAG: putative bifunctional diguanylate cyclase/phosphodiesterase [Acidimicrobiia bacterium]
MPLRWRPSSRLGLVPVVETRPQLHSGLAWGQRASGRVAGVTASLSATSALTVLAVLIVASWLAAMAVGGADVVPPHWFYVPIVFAAIRFGPLGAAGTAIASTFLAGPLLSPQRLTDWTTRGAFFLLIGQVIALLVREPATRRIRTLQVLRTERALRHALAAGELEVHYQPIVDIGGRRTRIIGAEALLRWHHPRQGLLSAAHFIDAAEETGLIHELGDWIFTEVCERIAQWEPLAGDPSFLAFINLSARQLVDHGLVERISDCLARTGVEPDRICLEITETAAMDDIAQTRERLTALQALGVHLAIDDFGTGYSSLAYVHALPVDLLKIDGSFITRVTDDPIAARLVQSIVGMAHTIGLKTVAEWVETQDQADFLRSIKCDYVQGFHMGQVTPPVEVTAALEAQAARRRSSRTRRQMRPVA